jgi:diguanylate cyclase (GGDEF)-like protein
MKHINGQTAHIIRKTIAQNKDLQDHAQASGFELTRMQSFVDGNDTMFDLLAQKTNEPQDKPDQNAQNKETTPPNSLRNFAESLTSALKFITKSTSKVENASHYVFKKETKIAPSFSDTPTLPAFSQALRDPLTGFLNRKGFLKMYAREIKRLNTQSSAKSGTLVIIDVENYESLFKRHGIVAAQKATFLTSKILAKDLQNIDFVARIHDDQFIVTLPDTPKASAIERVQRLAMRLNNLSFVAAGEELNLQTGIRIKSYRANAPQTRELTEKLA